MLERTGVARTWLELRVGWEGGGGGVVVICTVMERYDYVPPALEGAAQPLLLYGNVSDGQTP